VAVSLRLDWCSYEAAKFAVEHWHYSRKMPRSKLARIGVWEDERFVGAVIFGVGATPEIGKPYGLVQTEICELVRVALTDHRVPVSRVVAIAVRLLKRAMPGLRLIVSFADTSQGHHGGIYQAAGWTFVGSEEYHAYRVGGEVVHPRVLHLRFGVGGQSIPWLRAHVDPMAERIANGIKHKYVMPLDAEMRAKILPLAKPYPKRATSIDSDASTDHVEERGAMPTVALPILTAGA
jgi:hypothetical protein